MADTLCDKHLPPASRIQVRTFRREAPLMPCMTNCSTCRYCIQVRLFRSIGLQSLLMIGNQQLHLALYPGENVFTGTADLLLPTSEQVQTGLVLQADQT